MSRDPVLIAYSAKRSSRNPKRSYWRRIGEAYPHEEGAGLTIILDVLPPDGRIILLERDENDDWRLGADSPGAGKRTARTGSKTGQSDSLTPVKFALD